MKLTISILLTFVILPSIAKTQSIKQIKLVNPSSIERLDELIVFNRSELESRLGKISKFVEVKAGGKEVAVQHDDISGDGKWDEVIFLCSFKPREIVTLIISQCNRASSSQFNQLAHVRLKKKNTDSSWGPDITIEQMPFQNPATDFSKQPLPPYLTEGPAWENDRVGFRLYFDVRNGKDIWGKRTSRMVMDSVGTKVEPTYHEIHDWGMDVLHVGKSLGAGALALLIPQSNEKDTLLRIGGTAVVKTVYRQIADGPVRAIFQMNYALKFNDDTIAVSEKITIWADQYFYESKVFVSGAPANTKLVTGIASFYDNVFRTFSKGTCDVVFSHGKQSENRDYLGMSILVPYNETSFLGSSPNNNSEILNTYLAAMNIKKNQPCVFRFYAGWEKSEAGFASINFFSNMLATETEKIDHPIQIIF